MQTTPLTPWLPHKARVKPCDTICLHATAGGSAEGAISTLRKRGLSYHYIVEKNGHIYKCVPSESVAYHAGVSKGPHGTGVNSYSIGISFVNLNDGRDQYTQEQFDACESLVAALRGAFPIRYLTTHYWVSPGRKTDPKGFDVEKLARKEGLEIWKP